MEENTAIQLLQMDGKVLTDSRIVAKGIGIEHNSLMKTISTYQNALEEFGPLRFEIDVVRPQGGGTPSRYALLNRNQLGIVTSLSRNTKEVVRFKVDLFKAIDAMEKELAETKGQLAIALTFIEKARTLLDALGKGDPLAVMQSVQLLDLPLLNTVDAVLDILIEEKQAKQQPKRIDYPLSEESKEVLDVLDQAGCPVSAKELATMLGKDEITVLKTIFHMACREEIKRVDDAYVSLVLRDK